MKHKFKRGDKVVFLNAELHNEYPIYYPPEGSVGSVLIPGRESACIQWPEGTTGGSGLWHARNCDLAKAHTPLKTVLNKLRGKFRKK